MAEYAGEVYDLDFIKNLQGCQALIRDDGGNIAVFTDDHRMQTILETAMMMSRRVEVTYEGDSPKVLTRVKLNIG